MPLLSLAEVASRTGMARSSIYRLIDEGKLSATLDPRGRKCVELTEALRVFGAINDGTAQERKSKNIPNKPVITTRHGNETGQDTLVSVMQELEKARFELQFKAKELELKDRELALMQTRIEEVKSAHEQVTAEKNKFLEIIERQSLLLAAPKPARQRAPAIKKATTKAKVTPTKPVATSTRQRVSVAKKVTPKKPAPTVASRTTVTARKTAASKPSTKAASAATSKASKTKKAIKTLPKAAAKTTRRK